MKASILLIFMIALTGLAHANYDGNEIRGQLNAGKITGRTLTGEACSVTTYYVDRPSMTMVEVQVGSESILFNKTTHLNEVYRDEMPLYFEVMTEQGTNLRQGIIISQRGRVEGTFVQVFENENDLRNSDNNRVLHCVIP